jgi:hypothetical protein
MMFAVLIINDDDKALKRDERHGHGCMKSSKELVFQMNSLGASDLWPQL